MVVLLLLLCCTCSICENQLFMSKDGKWFFISDKKATLRTTFDLFGCSLHAVVERLRSVVERQHIYYYVYYYVSSIIGWFCMCVFGDERWGIVYAENITFVKGFAAVLSPLCCDADILKTIWSCCCFGCVSTMPAARMHDLLVWRFGWSVCDNCEFVGFSYLQYVKWQGNKFFT